MMRLSNKRFPTRKAVAGLVCAAAFAVTSPALAGPRAVYRVDSVSVESEGNKVSIEAHGAVRTGGWSDPRLVVKNPNGPTMILELRATPPGPNDMVIQALMPVTATTTVRAQSHISAIQVISETNAVSQPIGR